MDISGWRPATGWNRMSIVKRMIDDDKLPDVPPEAYSDAHTRELDDTWLAAADVSEQVAAMVEWFHARFWDPAHETPYMSSEGGYIWVHGGPYDATEQLQERFYGIASEDAIEHAINSVESDGIYDWAPTQLTYYDEEQDVFVDERNDPTQRLQERLDKIKAVLDLQGAADAVETARNQAYAGVIAALETFLWETMAYWVENEPKTVSNLITKLPVFSERPMKLGDIYSMNERLKSEVKAYMQHMVWHRWDDVARLVKSGLEIELPSFRPFVEPTKKRHDIVHRSGQDVDGNPIVITADDVRGLADSVLKFANDMDERVARSHAPVMEALEHGDF
jgi:hypothetical protein